MRRNDFLEGGNEGIPLWSVGITTDSVAGGILTESSNSGLAGIEIEGGMTGIQQQSRLGERYACQG